MTLFTGIVGLYQQLSMPHVSLRWPTLSQIVVSFSQVEGAPLKKSIWAIDGRSVVLGMLAAVVRLSPFGAGQVSQLDDPMVAFFRAAHPGEHGQLENKLRVWIPDTRREGWAAAQAVLDAFLKHGPNDQEWASALVYALAERFKYHREFCVPYLSGYNDLVGQAGMQNGLGQITSGIHGLNRVGIEPTKVAPSADFWAECGKIGPRAFWAMQQAKCDNRAVAMRAFFTSFSKEWKPYLGYVLTLFQQDDHDIVPGEILLAFASDELKRNVVISCASTGQCRLIPPLIESIDLADVELALALYTEMVRWASDEMMSIVAHQFVEGLQENQTIDDAGVLRLVCMAWAAPAFRSYPQSTTIAVDESIWLMERYRAMAMEGPLHLLTDLSFVVGRFPTDAQTIVDLLFAMAPSRFDDAAAQRAFAIADNMGRGQEYPLLRPEILSLYLRKLEERGGYFPPSNQIWSYGMGGADPIEELCQQLGPDDAERAQRLVRSSAS